MKKCSILIFLCSFSLLFSVELIKEENVGCRTFQIFEFNGHRYVHFRNEWNSADSSWIHDPDCPCVLEAINKIKNGV
jgi:hypothetical protein